MYWL
jgi:hypothetical protein